MLSSDRPWIPQMSPVGGAAPPLLNRTLHPAGYKTPSEGACESSLLPPNSPRVSAEATASVLSKAFCIYKIWPHVEGMSDEDLASPLPEQKDAPNKSKVC